MKKYDSPGVYLDIIDYEGELTFFEFGTIDLTRNIIIGELDASPWILFTGFWEDLEPWLDTEFWTDGPMAP